jgi:hypothetical protein
MKLRGYKKIRIMTRAAQVPCGADVVTVFLCRADMHWQGALNYHGSVWMATFVRRLAKRDRRWQLSVLCGEPQSCSRGQPIAWTTIVPSYEEGLALLNRVTKALKNGWFPERDNDRVP